MHRLGYGFAIAAFISLVAPHLRAQSAAQGDGIGTPKFATDQSVTNFSATAVTIPFWRSSFTDPTNGVTYPFTMVGTNPFAGDASTVIPTVIVPLRFTFAASADPSAPTLDGTNRVVATIASPMFQSADIGAAADATASAPPFGARTVNEPHDVTQVSDAIYRAQWNKSRSNYHVTLGQPTTLPTISFSVPANQGQLVVGSRSHAHIGLIEFQWFAARLGQALSSLKIDPGTLPIFLVDNVFLFDHTLDNCCTLGFHGATTSLNGKGRQQVNTYMFASYSTQGIFSANAGDTESFIADIHALSHEVQEWMDDPFVNNIVNPWLTPTAPQYGCTAFLETGDPVVGFGFKIAMPNGITYHPEDEVHFSWFARESPSRAARGYYTYLNNFPTFATGCQ